VELVSKGHVDDDDVTDIRQGDVLDPKVCLLQARLWMRTPRNWQQYDTQSCAICFLLISSEREKPVR